MLYISCVKILGNDNIFKFYTLYNKKYCIIYNDVCRMTHLYLDCHIFIN